MRIYNAIFLTLLPIILASMSRENNNQPIVEKPCYLKHELIEENPDYIKQEMKQEEIDEKPDIKPAEICTCSSTCTTEESTCSFTCTNEESTLELLWDVKTEGDVCDVCHGSFVKEE